MFYSLMQGEDCNDQSVRPMTLIFFYFIFSFTLSTCLFFRIWNHLAKVNHSVWEQANVTIIDVNMPNMPYFEKIWHIRRMLIWLILADSGNLIERNLRLRGLMEDWITLYRDGRGYLEKLARETLKVTGFTSFVHADGRNNFASIVFYLEE